MRLAKNKRGFSTDFIADFFSFLSFILILILFFVIFSSTVKISGCQGPGIRVSMVGEANNELNEEMMLLNYLRTNVSVNNEQMSIAELIAYSYLDNNYDELEEKTKEIFGQIDNQIYTTDKCSAVCIDVGNSRVKEIKTEGCEGAIIEQYCQEIKTTIPLFYTQPVKTAVVSLSYNVASERVIRGAEGSNRI